MWLYGIMAGPIQVFEHVRPPPEPQRKEPQIDLFPDTQEGDSKPGLANYLDEFLSAIKIFGYREPSSV